MYIYDYELYLKSVTFNKCQISFSKIEKQSKIYHSWSDKEHRLQLTPPFSQYICVWKLLLFRVLLLLLFLLIMMMMIMLFWKKKHSCTKENNFFRIKLSQFITQSSSTRTQKWRSIDPGYYFGEWSPANSAHMLAMCGYYKHACKNSCVATPLVERSQGGRELPGRKISTSAKDETYV